MAEKVTAVEKVFLECTAALCNLGSGVKYNKTWSQRRLRRC